MTGNVVEGGVRYATMNGNSANSNTNNGEQFKLEKQLKFQGCDGYAKTLKEKKKKKVLV